MLFIRVELWPLGDKNAAKTLGEAIIYNIGGTRHLGDYETIFSKRGGFGGNISTGEVTRVWKQGKIVGFRRLKGLAWDLLTMALFQVTGEERLKARGAP